MAEIKIQSVINKLRIRTVHKETWDIDRIGEQLALMSELDAGDAINYTHKIFDIVVDGITQGIHMDLGKLCIIGTDCDVQGNVKATFRASPELRRAVKAYRGRFKNAENKGLDDEGFARKWLEEHLDDTVIMRDGTSRTRDSYGL